jgi:preprotein translocase subunit Sss1
MDMTTVWVFIGCLISLVIGIVIVSYHNRRVKSWDKRPTTEEYMECLLIGLGGWMLIVVAGGCTLFVLLVLVIEVIKFLF